MNMFSEQNLPQPRVTTAIQPTPQAQDPATTLVCVLELYLGRNLASLKALSTIRTLCQEQLEGHCNLHIIDVYEHPEQLEQEKIIAAPTLIKKLPLPEKRFIGGLDSFSVDKLQLQA